jgi:hypothetical protein
VADGRSPLSDPTDLSARSAIFNTVLTASAWAQEADPAGDFTVVIAFNAWSGDAATEYRWADDARTGTA